MAQLKDTIVQGSLNVTNSIATDDLYTTGLRHHVLVGTGTAAVAYVAATDTAAEVLGKPALWKYDLGIATPQNGDMITILIPVAGHNNGVFVSLDNGANYKPVTTTGTSRLTTHFPAGQFVTLIYDTDGSVASVFPVNGASAASSSITGGCWRVDNYYDSNTNTLQRTYALTSTTELPLVAGSTSTAGAWSNYTSSYKDLYGVIPGTAANRPTINPSTGLVKIKSLQLTSALPAGSGGTGHTSLINAANALINALDTGSSNLTANDYVITQYVGGGSSTITYHRRPASAVVNATLVKAALGTDGSTTSQYLNKKGEWAALPTATTAALGVMKVGTGLSVSSGTVSQTAHTFTIGNTSRNYNGSANVSWTLAEIGAAASSHTHAYLPTSGGTLTGDLYINKTTDVGGTNSNGSLVIGVKAGANIGIDSDEIHARNNNAVSTLYLNYEGGSIAALDAGESYFVHIRSTKQSTTTGTGALVVSGGIGVGKQLCIGGDTFLAAGHHIYMNYNNSYHAVIFNHNNGNVSLRAAGGGLYIGLDNTSSINFLNNKAFITDEGNIWSGTTTDSTNEFRIGVRSPAGQMYLYAQAAESGSRGIYVPAHGTGSAKSMVVIDTNNNITFNGNASSATRLSGYLAANTANSSCNIWVASNGNPDAVGTYVSGFYINPSTKLLTLPGGLTAVGTINPSGWAFRGDNRNTATTPNDYNGVMIFQGIKTKAAAGSPSDATYAYTLGLRGWTDSSAGKAHEFAFTDYGVCHRIGSTTAWESWYAFPQMIKESYHALLPPDGVNNWIKIGTTNDSYGLIPSQLGSAGNGHNMLGTATWYWKDLYVDNIHSQHADIGTINSTRFTGYTDVGRYTTQTSTPGNWAIVRFEAQTSVMLSFKVRIMASYLTREYLVSGYNYTSNANYTTKFYLSKCVCYSNAGPTSTTSHNVYTGAVGGASGTYGKVWVAFPLDTYNGNQYPTIEVLNCTNAFTQANPNFYVYVGSSLPASGYDAITCYLHNWQAGESITSAVWNDYAEYRHSYCEEPGYVVYENGDDTLSKTTQRLQHFAGIVSDTWGFCQGETELAKTPIAVSGRVLAYTYKDRNLYQPGDCVCAAPNGTVDIMTEQEIKDHPDRIVGTVSCVPNYEEWGSGDRPAVKVDGRIWIKVR